MVLIKTKLELRPNSHKVEQSHMLSVTCITNHKDIHVFVYYVSQRSLFCIGSIILDLANDNKYLI